MGDSCLCTLLSILFTAALLPYRDDMPFIASLMHLKQYARLCSDLVANTVIFDLVQILKENGP